MHRHVRRAHLKLHEQFRNTSENLRGICAALRAPVFEGAGKGADNSYRSRALPPRAP